jgi:hypothetical protein
MSLRTSEDCKKYNHTEVHATKQVCQPEVKAPEETLEPEKVKRKPSAV